MAIPKSEEFEHGTDEERSPRMGRTNYTHFTVESNLNYRYTSAEELIDNKDDLLGMIKHHQKYQVPRLGVLDDYYKSRNTNIIQNERRKEEHKADHRAAHNLAKPIIEFDVGYNLAKPIAVIHEQNQEDIDEFHTLNDLDDLLSEIWRDSRKYGRAYTLQWRTEDDEDRIALSNTFETFVIYDTSIDKKPIAAIRYPKTKFVADRTKRENTVRPILYTHDEVIEFQELDIFSGELEIDDVSTHDHQGVPITEFQPNRYRMGLYEDILSIIDLYDAAQSDTANYMSDLNDALLHIHGDIESQGWEVADIIQMMQANILVSESGIDSNGNKTAVGAEYLYKQYDVQGIEAYKDRLKEDIYQISMVPDLSDEQFAGNQSGVAMIMKTFGFQQMTSSTQRRFIKSIKNIYRLLFNLKENLNETTAVELTDLSITFTPNIPQNDMEKVEMVTKLWSFLPTEELLKLLPFIENPAEMAKEIDGTDEHSMTDQERSELLLQQAEGIEA